MKNKGFTLIELLGVIIILALLMIIVFPSIVNSVKNSSNKTDDLTKELIDNAADLYIDQHINKFPKKNGNKFSIELKTLVDEGLLTSPIKLSGSDTDITNNKCVQVTYNKGYTYELKESGTCKEERPSFSTEYQQVEYIESTGTQYIDTGFIPNQDTGFDIVFSTTSEVGGSNFGAIIGARTSSSVNEFQITTYTNDQSRLGTFRFGDTSNNAGIIVNKKMHITLLNKIYTNNDIEHILTNTFTAPCNLTLFALNNNGSVVQHGKTKLYSLKLYNGDNLIRNFVPCYRKSDNTIGLYDLVNDVFYTNLGTGTFIKGENVYSQ